MRVNKGGTRKHGRNKIKCQLYFNQHRREKNKIRKWQKMIKKLSPDNNMRKELKIRTKKMELKIMGVKGLDRSKSLL